MRTVVIAFVALTVCSCSSTPTSTGERRPVPSDRVFDSSAFVPSSEHNCRVTITRDKGFVSGGNALDVFLDGHRVARVRTGESVTLYTSPGRHFVGVKYTWGLAAPAERDINATPGQLISLPMTVNSACD